MRDRVEPARSPAIPILPDQAVSPINPPRDLNQAVSALGRRLFHDPRLSRDNTVSCATCHDLKRGGSDGRKLAVGVAGQRAALNSPTVLNSAIHLQAPWNDPSGRPEERAARLVHYPTEMASSWSEVAEKLGKDQDLANQFKAVWGEEIRPGLIQLSIAEFLRGLVTPDSPYDRFLRGESTVLSERAKAGEKLFRQLGCIECHQGVNLGGNMYAGLGIMADFFAEHGSKSVTDLGRYNITGREQDKHVFKVPTLRNAKLTAPYFHDGSMETLEEAVRAMAEYQVGVDLDNRQVGDLVAFLDSLTGRNPELRP